MQGVPFETPSELAEVPAAAELSSTQKEAYAQVLQYFTAKSDTFSLTERVWLTEECFLRYLRATKWDVAHAQKRIESTLEWRKSFGVDKLDQDAIAIEWASGKELILGWDNAARPCLYLKPGKQNTKASHTQVEALVYMLERAIDLMVPGQDQLALLIDFQPYKVPNSEASKLPSLGTGREVLNILQDHYPERLGKALLTNMPRLAKLFLKMISPFIDPMTREKLVFSEPFPNFVPKEQLDADYGGECNFEYDNDTYLPALKDLTEANRKHYLARFEELGGTIGLKEADLRK